MITAAERTALGTAVQTETDPTVTLAKLEGLVVDFHTLGGVDADTQLNAAGVTALETDPDFNASAASSITSAGSNQVITATERIALGTAVQTETDPTVTLAKLEGLVEDFHSLGGIDADTDTQLTDGQIGIMGYLKAADLPAETDPAVGANTLNYLSKWDGSALVAGSIFDNGNVGIGTTSPNFQLSLGAALSHTKIALYETGATNHYGMGIVAGQFSFHLNGSGARYAFYDSDDLTNELLTVKGSGNVGIGTENPQAKLHIGGTAGVDGIKFPDGTTQTTAASASPDYIWIREESGSAHGGTFSSGAWRTRVLNIEKADIGGHATLSSNQITLAAGTYRIAASAPAYKVNRHQTRLYNVTGGTTIIAGTSEYIDTSATYSDATRSFINGQFTLATSKVIELQHRCSTSVSNQGLGIGSTFGEVSVYSEVQLWRISD